MLTIDYETKKSIREAFGKKLEELGSENSNIVVLDADLANSTQTKFFAKKFPERFFDVGIAEQDLMTTALVGFFIIAVSGFVLLIMGMEGIASKKNKSAQ